jgi:predicted phage terminase large subunit-like protein
VTRWSKIDLPGQILKRSIHSEGSDEWEIISLPALVDEHTDKERPIWPGFWSLEELRQTRATLDVQKWQSQYQQNPTSEEGALVKREWWKEWKGEKPPKTEFIIQAWDTAFLAKETADFSACTTWGVWRDEEGRANLILIDAIQERLEFPDLKRRAKEKYNEYNPDAFIVEAKAAGTPLTFELRRMGIPVQDFRPSRGNDKIARMNAVTDLFSSGMVWAPPTRWAEEVIEQCAEFPHGEADDLVDTVTMALLRFRKGGFITLDADEKWRDEEHFRRRVAAYY